VSRVGFSLIELLLVIFLISFISFLVIKLPSYNRVYTFKDLREIVYPNGTLIIGKNIYLIKNSKKIKLNFLHKEFEVFNKDFQKLNLPVIYKMKNGIGDFIIIKEKKVYMYKPLFLKTFNSLNEAKNYLESLNR
jgi:hypothetical protein